MYPLNRSHSDLIVLKRLLLGDRVESLYAMLDDSYSRYMAFCNAFEESGKQLQMVVQVGWKSGGCCDVHLWLAKLLGMCCFPS